MTLTPAHNTVHLHGNVAGFLLLVRDELRWKCGGVMGKSLFWEKAETWQEMLTRHPESLMDPLHIGIIVIQQAARYLNKISTSMN